MPCRDDVKKVLIIGSGPIVIGQACEFDYSGTQACKALRELGYKIVLVNSNPATIMTDTVMADATYIEPATVTSLERIIEKERPDALLPNLGGQSALNLATALQEAGVLEKYGVRVIGVQLDAIERGEDRQEFKNTMKELGIETPRSAVARTQEEADEIAAELGFPVVVRPAYTMGGVGGGICYNLDEFRAVVSRGLAASPVSEVLIEESVAGWSELELEVLRDSKNKLITVCFIENVDPMGVHTGDSFCTAPMLTVSDEIQKRLEQYAHKIVERIGIIGGANVQFAHDPVTDRIVVIEINPRTSRSSALASKATGFPIAHVSAKLAAGMTLDEMPYWRAGTLDKYEPYGDYVVVKFARWAFEKFPGVEDKLGTQMRAVGEVMSIGKTFKESFQKAIRSLEKGRLGLGFAKDFHDLPVDELLDKIAIPNSWRYFQIYEALRKGATIEQVFEKTKIKRYFLEQMLELVELEEKILTHKGKDLPDDLLKQAKLDGFSDKYLSELLGRTEKSIREQRYALGVKQVWNKVQVSGVEDACYWYSTYHGTNENVISSKRKIMVLGGGPNRIGQGIEFDYCCVHCAMALRRSGYETIMVNCNPETVSTDYDVSHKLYFEPLTLEDVLSIYEAEQPNGVVVQFGGQTPLNLAADLAASGVKIIGTSPETIAMAEDRDKFRHMMKRLGIPEPESGVATNVDEAREIAERIGYPLMVRPSFVLGGRAMEVVHDEQQLVKYVEAAVDVSPEHPILIDRFLANATETEADAISDGENAFVPSVMEHVELAGIHSGDSACVIPPISISARHVDTIRDYTRRIAVEMGVVGLMNIQYAIADDTVYILEANPRASRTVPLVSKVCDIQMAQLATRVMLGERISELNLLPKSINHYGVKEAVFPFNMFQEVDPILGPEMRSTGEVLGLAHSFGLAFYKAEEAAGSVLPKEGSILMTVSESDRNLSGTFKNVARGFSELGFKIYATEGTSKALHDLGIECEKINKIYESQPNIIDLMINGEINLVINTPLDKRAQTDDSFIRKNAIRLRIPYMTTLAAAYAAYKGIVAIREGRESVHSLQEYHNK